MVFQLDPFTGYWVRAFQDCELLVPPTPIRTTTARRTPWPQPEWTLTLRAETAGGSDTLVLGVHRQATAGFDPWWDQAAPPPAPEPNPVRLFIPHPEWGPYADVYRTDIRRATSGRVEWTFQVETPLPRTEVVLTWENLRQVSGDGELILIDESTKTRWPLRTQRAYRFVSGDQGEQRRFRLLFLPGQRRRLGVRNLQVQPLRGSGWSIEYELTQAATVRLRLKGLSGRLWRDETLGLQPAGRQRHTWRLQDERGRPLPPGVYLLEVEAETPDHRRARAVRQVLIPR
jgi:hypothetical protein